MYDVPRGSQVLEYMTLVSYEKTDGKMLEYMTLVSYEKTDGKMHE